MPLLLLPVEIYRQILDLVVVTSKFHHIENAVKLCLVNSEYLPAVLARNFALYFTFRMF